ncbi:MAG: MFS transporter [Thermoplasmata archaeon]
MAQDQLNKGSIAARMERLPFSKFHRNFLLMLTSGEWAESLMLLGNGAVLTLVAAYFMFPKGSVLAEYAIPVPFFLGEFVGALFFGWLGDKKGRRTVFLYNQLIFGFGMILAGLMPVWQLIALFVFIGGIGVGGEFPLVDSYSSEVVQGRIRGKGLAVIYTIAVTAAPVIVYMTKLTSHMGYYSFRIPMWFMGIVAIFVWLVRLRLTESPRWLETQGRSEEADKIMTDIEERIKKEKNLKELPPVNRSINPKISKSSYKDIFAPDVRKRTIMMLVFQFFQSGIFYGFATFAPGLLVSKGLTITAALGFATIIYTGFFFGSIFNIFIIDKVERKYGIISMAILAAITGTLFAVANNITIAVILGFLVAFFLWNFSNFYHTYQAEIFPTRIRPTAAGTVYSVSRISTSILTLFIAYVFLPHGALAVFAIIWVFVLIVVIDILLFGPRTSKKTVEEIVV